MRRRAFLSTGVATLSALAGCQGGPPDGSGSRTSGSTDPASGASTRTETVSAEGDYPVAESELRRGAPEDAIPAIVDTAFGDDWSGIELDVESRFGGSSTIEPRLAEDDEVVGVEREGEARAYPLRLLNWHEVANDDFGGPLLVSYCPLCRTGVTAVRTVNGKETIFGVSGTLWNSNLVMYDEMTESLWSQVAATAIRGPEAGSRMTLVPSTITGLSEWRDSHPDTEVLLPPPESSTVVGDDAARNYNVDPYSSYENNRRVGLGRSDYDDRLHPKALVVGVSDGDAATAYPLPAVQEAGLLNDRVGDLPVVVTTDSSGALVAYDRRVDGETLGFEAAGADAIRGGGSTWRRSTGRALDGPHGGTTLERANDRTPMFWFSWADIFPESTIYGRDGGTRNHGDTSRDSAGTFTDATARRVLRRGEHRNPRPREIPDGVTRPARAGVAPAWRR